MALRKPNFLVVGAQKSGTTYLCAGLVRHTQVFHSDPKELLFFQRADVDDASFEQYLQHFAGAGDATWVGEGSAIYLQRPRALENIRRYLGDDVRIFICLRQPADRAVSFYLHNLRRGRLTGTEPIDHADGDIFMSPWLSSYYGEHVERWLEAYGDRVHILLYDDLVEAPHQFLRSATDFLGITPLGPWKDTAVNRGYVLEWDDDALTIAGPIDDGATRPRFTRTQLEDLQSHYLGDIARTEAAIGRPLDAWKKLPEFTAKLARF